LPARTAEILTVTIEDVAFGGAGVAKENGKVFFVDDAVPGDQMRIEVIKSKKRYATAKCIEMIRPSQDRSPPPCPYHAQCGGCTWQGIEEKKQLGWKKGFVEQALQRIAKIGEQKCQQIHASPASYHYRNRIQLKGQIEPNSALNLGYYARSSNLLVAIDECLIAQEPINISIRELRKFSWPVTSPQTFLCELQVVKDSRGSAKTTLSLTPTKGRTSALISALIEFANNHCPSILWAGSTFDCESAPYALWQESLDLRFSTKPSLFQQINIPANLLMQTEVLRLASELQPRRVLDLYCGSGNLSLPLAKAISCTLIGVEFSEESTKCAVKNARDNDVSNCQFLSGDAAQQLRRFAERRENFDLILADPPRAGMQEALSSILTLAPRDIIYVSCDPSTLARDLGVLCAEHYLIKQVQAFDFFPHTHHVETLVHLQKKGNK